MKMHKKALKIIKIVKFWKFIFFAEHNKFYLKRNQNFLTCSMLQVYICARNFIHFVQNCYQNDDFIEWTYDTLTKWIIKKAWKTRNHAGGCHYLFFISQVWIEKLLKIWHQDSVIRTNAVILETMMGRLRLAQIRDCYLDLDQ